MWPVLTLTLLLQLTDEEQLYAGALQPDPQAVKEAGACEEAEAPAAQWPVAEVPEG
jgi:hypothetical protein